VSGTRPLLPHAWARSIINVVDLLRENDIEPTCVVLPMPDPPIDGDLMTQCYGLPVVWSRDFTGPHVSVAAEPLA
jgi:hypothetical protein